MGDVAWPSCLARTTPQHGQQAHLALKWFSVLPIFRPDNLIALLLSPPCATGLSPRPLRHTHCCEALALVLILQPVRLAPAS